MLFDRNKYNEILKKLNSSDVYIYGAGYIANIIYNAIKVIGQEHRIVSFITTTGSKELVEGLPIISIDEFQKLQNKNAFIGIAVHEAILGEITQILDESRIFNYEWLVPFQFALTLGEPIEINARVQVKSILERYKGNYAIALKYLAIENYYGKNTFGFDLYVDCMAMNCSYNTALRRKDKFCELIKDFEKKGFRDENPIPLLDGNVPIDGTHRLALSCYNNIKEVPCDIYPCKKSLLELHEESGVLTENFLIKQKVQMELIKALQNTERKIGMQYEI